MSKDKLEQAVGRAVVQDGSSTKEVEEEAVWIKTSLTNVLNSYATPLRVTACSKRGWITKVKVKCKEYG